MVHIINNFDWCRSIGDAIQKAESGDTIVVDNALKATLVEKARLAQCPDKQLIVQIEAVQAA